MCVQNLFLVPHVIESCLYLFLHMNESCPTNECVMSHIRISSHDLISAPMCVYYIMSYRDIFTCILYLHMCTIYSNTCIHTYTHIYIYIFVDVDVYTCVY